LGALAISKNTLNPKRNRDSINIGTRTMILNDFIPSNVMEFSFFRKRGE